jgi:hypothetical protein
MIRDYYIFIGNNIRHYEKLYPAVCLTCYFIFL